MELPATAFGRRRWICAVTAAAFVLAPSVATAEARTLRQDTAIAAAETRSTPGDLVSECDRVTRTRVDCWLLSFGMAEVVDGDTGEATPVAVEIYVRVFYRRGRLYTWMPLTDDHAVAVRKLMPRRARLRIQKTMP
jgi:hypothetical protein